MGDIFGERSSTVSQYTKAGVESFGAIRVQSENGGGSGLVSPVIFVSFTVTFREKIQVVESFNEVVHIYAYGKGAGQLILGGHVLAECNSNPKLERTRDFLITEYEDNLRAFQSASKGDLVKVAGPGNIVVSGVVDSLQVAAISEYNNKLDFTLTMTTSSSAFGFNSGNSNSGGGGDSNNTNAGADTQLINV